MKFRHAGAGRHPGVAVGGNPQSLDSGFRRKDEKEKVDFKWMPRKIPRVIAEGCLIFRAMLSFNGHEKPNTLSFLLITCHRESAQILLRVYQIHRQSEAEHHGKSGHEIDDGASRFESPGFELCACASIT